MKTVLKTDEAPKALGPYSQGIKNGQIIFLSGQLGLDPLTNEFCPGGIQEQTRQALTNLKNILESTGLGMDNVVKTTVFLKEMSDFQAMNSIYAEFFTSNHPARSTVQVSALPKSGLVEIEAIAIAD